MEIVKEGGVEEEQVCGLIYCSYLPFATKRRWLNITRMSDPFPTLLNYDVLFLLLRILRPIELNEEW